MTPAGKETKPNMMVPVGFSRAEEQKDGFHQPLTLEIISVQAPTPQTNALNVGDESLSHEVWALFHGLLLCWALVVSRVSAHRPFKSVLWASCECEPYCSQSQMSWELISEVLVLKVGLLNAGYELLAPQREAPDFEFPPACGLPHRGWHV